MLNCEIVRLFDAFFHKYAYNTDKKIKAVYTSRDDTQWDKDASYQYYPHGPLRSAIIGQDQVQKIDYGYTIMGWLYRINCSNNIFYKKI